MPRWWGSFRITVLVAVAAALVVGLGTARAASTTLVVDDDGNQCPTAGYSVIDDAIAAANPGDTIVVCPGDYDAATVTTRVTLRGFTPDISTASKCAPGGGYPADNSATNSIVAGFAVEASHVTITGFTLRGPAADGVHIPNGLTSVGVTRNVFQDNTNGINLNGGSVVVDHNCIRDNITGIYSDQGLVSASIANNAFVDNSVGDAITLIGDGLGSLNGVLVDRNSSSGDGDLISLIGSTNTTVSNNTVTGSVGSAIYVQDSNSDLTVTKNTLTGSGAGEGIAINAGVGTPNERLTLTSNKVTSNGSWGIVAAPSSLDDSTFSKNTVSKNAFGGLVIAPDNNGNLFEKNKLKGNGVYDCYDDDTNVNTWKNDNGKTQNRAGLCKGAKVV